MHALYEEEPQSIFVIRNPFRFLSHKGRQIGSYVAGGLVAIGWWVFLDAVVQSSTGKEDSIRMGFEDWFSGILSTFGMIVINLIDKSRLQGEAFTYSASDLVWKARLFLFLGFALLGFGFAGSCSVMIIKYIVRHDGQDIYYGVAGVVQCSLIMLSTVVLWVAQGTQEEYEYNLRI
ncbi:uncharacterized protein BX664DRAFT_294878 [Halteromyces radiatus]|uniref:uncharacterized protein n=1 Tax=Halteromyces radiatus TaxID=101107 RepID=UPI00221FC7D2|nr:uncharacterized protein BX664DRAFT_294878 [Halteromyces radiatus]KAI8093254.1 hypothetical protein BX664DRAFT_294878 [Halteromyces radiatus]